MVFDEAGPRYPSKETFYNMLEKSVSVTRCLKLDQGILVGKHFIICWKNLGL